jgi:hypothetical protein
VTRGSRHLSLLTTAAIALLALAPAPASGQLKFQVLETEYLRVVYYDEEHAYVLPHLARCFENSMGYYRDFFGYTPTEEVTILLQDFDDYGYAGTSTIPNNYITLGIEPFEYVYETCPTNERFNWVMSHELVHVVASEKAASGDRYWRKVFFGKVMPNDQNPESIIYSYLSNPRRYAPRWYHEGIAVFMETWLAGGIGRALGGYDEMVFRTMVHDGAYFYDVVGLESEGTTSDFQIGQNSYLYGTRFMSYLALQYGPETVIDWVNRRQGTKGYFASDFKRVYGKSLHREWKKWIAWERGWQADNLAAVRAYPVTAERRIAGRAMGSASRGFYDRRTNRLLAAVNYPGDFAHLAAIDLATGEARRLGDVQTPALYYVTSLAFDEEGRTLFFTTNNGKHWRDLHAVDVETGKMRALLANNRTGDLVFNRADRAVWGVQHHNGQSVLVRIRPPYDSWDRVQDVLVMPYGKDLFDIDISRDGEYLTASMIEVTGRTKLIRVHLPSLLEGNAAYDVLWEFTKTAPANFAFSADGRYLYGTSYQTGVSNVFRFDFERSTMDCMSNCETGYFRPIPVGDDSLIVYRYTSEGLEPAVIPVQVLEDVNAVSYLGNEIVRRHPVVKEWKLGSPRAVDLDSVVTYRGSYNKVRSVTVASAYPVVEGYKHFGAVGLRLNFMDPLGMHGGSITASYTGGSHIATDERLHARLDYRHFPWTLEATYNRADFYDLFGPRRTSRKGYSVSLSRNDYIIIDKPRFLEYTVTAAYFGDLEEVPFHQDVPATYDELATLYAALDYKRVRKSIGAVDEEKGARWNLGYAGNYVNDQFYSRFRGRLDLGVHTPLDHSSVWLRGYAGYSLGDPEDTFANFYFGGFQNNYVDHLEPKRYRDYDPFPGAEISEISGTRFGKAQLEWTLPPWRFERVGIPNFYCTWMRTALFGGAIVTNISEDAPRQKLVNAGIQVDFRLVMFFGLESMLSVGYAGATGDDRETTTEFMISLKIL